MDPKIIQTLIFVVCGLGVLASLTLFAWIPHLAFRVRWLPRLWCYVLATVLGVHAALLAALMWVIVR